MVPFGAVFDSVARQNVSRPLMSIRRIAVAHSQRLIRFGLVGCAGVVVNMAILYLLVEHGRLNHLIAAAIASEVSILSNFVLNDRWTFRQVQARHSWLRRAAHYNAVALSGLAISLSALAFLTLYVGMHYLIANLFAIAAATASNYLLNLRLTWSTRADGFDEDPLVA